MCMCLAIATITKEHLASIMLVNEDQSYVSEVIVILITVRVSRIIHRVTL